jgi:hypothetical protein
VNARDGSAYANDGRVVWAENGDSLTLPDNDPRGDWQINVWNDGLARAYDQGGQFFPDASLKPVDAAIADIIGAPQTKYDGSEHLAWNGNGWDVLCWAGADHMHARVELFVGGDGMQAESYWTEGDPERQQHATVNEALDRFLAVARR